MPADQNDLGDILLGLSLYVSASLAVCHMVD